MTMTRPEGTGGAATLHPNENRVKDQIKRLHEYVWARHIDGSDHYDHSINEEDAIRILESHYSEIGNRNSPDQVYLGILLFERAFQMPESQDELFERARKIFEFYRRVTGEHDWPAVEDRLQDIVGHFEGEAAPPAEAAAPAPEAAPAAAAVAEPPPAVAEAPPAVAPPPPPPPEPVRAELPRAPVVESAAEDIERRREEEKTRRREAREAFIAGLEVVEGMQLVPAGTFLFGPDNREIFLDAFYIDRLPVTNAEYMRFVRETGYRAPRYADDPKLNQPDQPVVGVSFGDARQYARWAGKELPTELQWEKAARGTDGRPYPWGNDPPGASDACFGQDPVEGAPAPVGKSLRNVSQFGVQDTCGTVWEWTTTPFAKNSEYRIVRGGCYNDPPEFLMLHERLEANPKEKCEAIGFRCIRNVHA
jgi:serine/threonine-protein kinase